VSVGFTHASVSYCASELRRASLDRSCPSIHCTHHCHRITSRRPQSTLVRGVSLHDQPTDRWTHAVRCIPIRSTISHVSAHCSRHQSSRGGGVDSSPWQAAAAADADAPMIVAPRPWNLRFGSSGLHDVAGLVRRRCIASHRSTTQSTDIETADTDQRTCIVVCTGCDDGGVKRQPHVQHVFPELLNS
jgi:hypothetical protein